MKTTAIKRFAICLVALVAAAVMMLSLSACGPKEIKVNIVDGNDTTEVTTEEGKTVEDILAANDITLEEGDVVDPSLDTEIEGNDATITIQRMQSIVIAVDGNNVDVALLAGSTVQDALDKAEVTLADGDTVDIDAATLIEDGMVVMVTRAKKEEPKATTNTSSKSTSKATNSTSNKPAGKTVVSRTKVPNCDDGSHGYEEIHYSDGTVEYREY